MEHMAPAGGLWVVVLSTCLHLSDIKISTLKPDGSINFGGVLQKLFRGSDAEKADELLSRLETLSTLGQIISRICNCSFLFWHRSFIAAYFGSIIENSSSRPEVFSLTLSENLVNLKSNSNYKLKLVLSFWKRGEGTCLWPVWYGYEPTPPPPPSPVINIRCEWWVSPSRTWPPPLQIPLS